MEELKKRLSPVSMERPQKVQETLGNIAPIPPLCGVAARINDAFNALGLLQEQLDCITRSLEV